MSTSLAYRPVVETAPKTLSDELKYILRDKYNLNDGFIILTSEHIPYLEGLSDAKIRDADKLIQAIIKHSKIELFLY